MDQDNKRVVEIVEILLERHFPETPENAKQNLKVVIPSEESVDLLRELREILCSEKSVISLEHFMAMSSTKRIAIHMFLKGFIYGTWSMTTPREERKIRREPLRVFNQADAHRCSHDRQKHAFSLGKCQR